MSRPTTLYRFFDADGELLYVGISARGAARWSEHKAVQLWWPEIATATLTHYETRAEALAAESKAIRIERPIHNATGPGTQTRRARPEDERPEDERALRAVRRRRERLDVELAIAVKSAAADGASSYAIGAAVGLSHSHVQRIVRGDYDKRLAVSCV